MSLGRRARFLLALLSPILLAAWAWAVEPAISLTAWGGPTWGAILIAFACVLIIGNAWQPALARWFPRPPFSGFAIACFGVSMYAGSRAGLWLVSPAVAMGAMALALGGHGVSHPMLPPADDLPPTLGERVRFWFCCALPWVAVYEFTVHMRLPGHAFMFSFEDTLPIYPATSILYQSTYAAVTAAPFLARTRSELRRLTLSAWLATVLVFPFYWLIPSAAPRRPMTGDHILARLLSFERNIYPPSAAFPSFHVLWSIFVGRLIRPAPLGWLYALAIAVSCITTGMHYIPDVLVSFAIAPLFMNPEELWRSLRRTNLVAPSRVRLLARIAAPFLIPVVLAHHSAPLPLTVATYFLGVGLVEIATGSGKSRSIWWTVLPLAIGVCLTLYPS